MPSWLLLSVVFAVVTSINTPISKRILQKMETIPFIIISSLFSVPLLFVVVLILGFPKTSANFYLFIFSAAVLDIAAAFLSLKAIKTSPISLISPISAFNPVFTTLIAFLLLGEKLDPLKFLGIIIVVVGAYLLNFKNIKTGIFQPITALLSNNGVRMFFAANFLWGITPIFQKQAIALTIPKSPLFVSFTESFLLLLFFSLFIPRLKFDKKAISGNIKFFIIFAILSVFGAYVGLTAFSLTNLGYATAVFKLSILFTVIWGALFFKEERTIERFVGASVMVFGTFLLLS